MLLSEQTDARFKDRSEHQFAQSSISTLEKKLNLNLLDQRPAPGLARVAKAVGKMLGLLVRFVLRLALWASGGLLAFIVVSVLTQVYQANMAYLDFKRKSKGLFVAKDRSWLCNHTVSWGLRKNALNEAFNDYKQHGQRNYAVLIRDQFGVTTLDPNVMARIVLDEPNKNLKRAKVDGPASEFMEDSIMLAEGDQWSRLRRAVGPALR